MIAIWVWINPKLVPLGSRVSLRMKFKGILDSVEMLLLIKLVIIGACDRLVHPDRNGSHGSLVGAVAIVFTGLLLAFPDMALILPGLVG